MPIHTLTGERPAQFKTWEAFLLAGPIKPAVKEHKSGVTMYSFVNCHYIVLPDGLMVEYCGFRGLQFFEVACEDWKMTRTHCVINRIRMQEAIAQMHRSRPLRTKSGKEIEVSRFGIYSLKEKHLCASLSLWTIFTKDKNCKRGDYAEELDVVATSQTQARQIAEAVLEREYEPGLRISRIEWRGKQ